MKIISREIFRNSSDLRRGVEKEADGLRSEVIMRGRLGFLRRPSRLLASAPKYAL